MAAKRYWQVKGIDVPGSFLEIEELQLHDSGGNVNSSATKSVLVAPSAGSFGSLFDGTGAFCAWTAAVAEGASFYIRWDFGASPKDCIGFKQQGHDDSGRYMAACSWYSGDSPFSGDHRYWRIKSLSIPDGSFLEISELQLWGNDSGVSASLNGSATITASTNPDFFGSFSSLIDGFNNTRCIWNKGTAENAGFSIKWDFGGTPRSPTGWKQCGFDTSTRYISAATWEWSDDNSSWTTAKSFSGLSYPGNETLSSLYEFDDPAPTLIKAFTGLTYPGNSTLSAMNYFVDPTAGAKLIGGKLVGGILLRSPLV